MPILAVKFSLITLSLTAIFMYVSAQHSLSQTLTKDVSVHISPSLTPSPTPLPSPTLTPEPTLTPTPLPPTATPTPVPTISVRPDLETLFSKYATEYNADEELMKRIARCESGFNPDAVNDVYIGLFQFTEQTWIYARNSMQADPNPDLRKNAEDAIRTAAYMIGNGQAMAWRGCE